VFFPAVTISRNPVNTREPTPPLLELQNVVVMRGTRPVLRNLNLRIQADEHVAIVGPNGCGKSTLIKTITRECYPLTGDDSRMAILGQESWNVFDLRNLLGIVSNDLMAFLTSESTGFDVVLSGFFSSAGIYSNHLVDRAQRSAAQTALAQLQVSHLAERSVCEMSSGEAKRILIARALVHSPRALLFDEPSNSLDFTAHQALRESMSALAKSGIGLILVTHDLSDIVPEISRVLLMSRGQIVADGPKEQILEPGKLSEVFGTRVEVARRNGHYYLWG
jgi:iron complex transport system ATP-binding protein